MRNHANGDRNVKKAIKPAPQEQMLLRAIRRVARRLRLVRFWDLLLRCVFYSLVAAILVVVITKVTPLRYPPVWLVVGFGLASLPLAIALFLLSPITLFDAAVIADQRLRLKEKLSSAVDLILAGKGHDDEIRREWRAALVDNANQSIRSINPNRSFPFQSSREGRFAWLPLVLSLVVTFLMPEMDWWAGKSAQAGPQLQEGTVRELKKLAERQLLSQRERKGQQFAKTEKISREIGELSRELAAGKIERREMMSRLAKITDQIQLQRAEFSECQPNLQALRSPLHAELPAELAEALKESDYTAAAVKLSELKKLLDQGKMTEEEQQQLSQELGNLSASLEDNSALGKALKAAAVNLEARDPAGVLSALNMAASSIEDLKDLAAQIALLDNWMAGVRACRASLADVTGPLMICPLCGGMCGGKCQGLGGMGGYGRGRGGRAPFAETETTLLPDGIAGQFKDAPTLGTVLVRGLPARGEASVGFSDAVLQSRQVEEDALNREKVPLIYRSSVRRYFDALETENRAENGG
jgi:hypothetical protein